MTADVVFLDANVLFSAAYREDSGLRRLWELDRVELITSSYAVEEARANLSDRAQRSRLERLLRPMTVVGEARSQDVNLPSTVKLPPKDQPILTAAIQARASFLLTGDVRHFGPLFGEVIGGVRILTPADFLRDRR